MIQKTLILLLSLFVMAISIQAQDQIVTHEINEGRDNYHSELAKQLKEYKVVSIDEEELLSELSDFSGVKRISFKIDEEESWPLEIIPQNTLIESMKVVTALDGDITDQIKVYPYRGNVLNNTSAKVSLTVADGFIYAYFQDGAFNRFLEPLKHLIPGSPSGMYVVYNGDDVIFPEGDFCASSHMLNQTKEMTEAPQKLSLTGLCFEVEYATASDFSMFTKYVDAAGVTAHNIGVMNNVQNNYDDEFDDELLFVNVEQWISNCSSCDPWTTSLDPGVFLGSFRTWGIGGGFSTPVSGFDFAQIWTNRDFSGSTIGIAYVGVVCTGSKYQALQDFSSNANLKRVMVAHETGHNFNAVQSATGHDPSGSAFIMAPSVSNVSTWSAQSISDVEAHYNSRTCLASCAAPAPPVSEFVANLTDICPGTTIQFFDQSTNTPTSWSWSFAGGSPANSSMQNPTVTYANTGTYNVTLTATNGSGSDTETKNGYITVGASGTEIVLSDDFSSGLNNWTVDNPDNATTWETKSVPGSSGNSDVAWINNFDYNNGTGALDGLESAVLDFNGRNNITLKLEYAFARYNSSNSDIFRIKVSTNGGNSFPNTVFTGQENGNGNFATVSDQVDAFEPIDDTEWCISTMYGPNCISIDLSAYTGQSNVVIRLENESDYGNNLYLDNVLITSDCQVLGPPVAEFTSNINTGCVPLIVQFQDLSTNSPTSWNWTFPGGNPAASTQQNPIVTYINGGSYNVSLMAANPSGSNSITKTSFILAQDVPVSSFTSSVNASTVVFTNTSQNGTFYDWNFGDGEGSTNQNPVHVYDEDGVYVVSLTVGNACGSTTVTAVVQIATVPVADFGQSTTEGCASLEVEFYNESSSNVDEFLWTFEGGTPSTSTEENPIVMYSSEGIFDVTLLVTNETGDDELLVESLIAVNDVPSPDFSSFEDGFTVDFTNLTMNADSYSWDFGDGNGSMEENPSHTYDSDGDFTVTLTATNICGDGTLSQIVTISNLPNAGGSANVTTGCIDFVVQFTDNSSSNVDSWLWTFEGGSPSVSTDQNPIVTYTSVGVFDVGLVVTNQEGSDALTLNDYITVLDLPTAAYTYTENQLEYTFTNSSTLGSTYLWDFGDNQTSSLENPIHLYDTDGTYTIVLTVTNICGVATFETTVNVFSQVTGSASANITSGCADLVVQFQDNSSSNVTGWAWSFPGGTPSTSTLQNPVVTYQTAGTFTVTLIVSNGGFNDEVVLQDYIVVTDVPESNFSYDFDLLNVDFTNTTVNGDSYFWDFGDTGTSNAENPSHTYANEGEYDVMLIATNDCGADTTVWIVNVSSFPTSNFTSDIQSGCIVMIVDFEDLSTSNTTEWLWTFEGGTPATSTEQNPTIQYQNTGVFDVTLTASNDAGEDVFTLEDFITVASTPVASIGFAVTDNSVSFSSNASGADSYEWSFQGITGTFDVPNPTIVFPADGVYSVELKVTNECGTSTFTTAIEITAYPDAEFQSNLVSGCSPLSVQFMDNSQDNVTSWFWEFSGGVPSVSADENPVIQYDVAGVYPVKLTVSNNVGDDVIIKEDYIVVDDSPIANFDFSIDDSFVQFTNTSVGGGDSFWDFGDGETSEDENPLHEYAVSGNYQVMLIENNGVCADTIFLTITTIVDNILGQEEFGFVIYPIPSHDYFIMEFDTDISGLVQYTVLDALGRNMKEGSLLVQKGNETHRVDIGITAGLYFLKIQIGEREFLQKLIIE